LIEPNHKIPIIRQCELLGVNRSGYYYKPKPENLENLKLMSRIDEIYTRHPYYGYLRMTAQLNRERDNPINHKRIARLMIIMQIQAIRPKKNLSKRNKEHSVYPYLLRGLEINHSNQVWGTDITYVRAKGNWFYLVAVMDWYSRYVLSWRLSPTLETSFCAENLKEALGIGRPEIHNSDQGSQFTSEEYLKILKQYSKTRISMDGRGRCFDNIFTERLWRNVKYEEIYLKDYSSYQEAKESLREYFWIYNNERLHQNLNYQTPSEVYFGRNTIKTATLNISKVETNNLVHEYVT